MYSSLMSWTPLLNHAVETLEMEVGGRRERERERNGGIVHVQCTKNSEEVIYRRRERERGGGRDIGGGVVRKGEDYYIVQRHKGCICVVRTPGIVYSCHVFLYKALVVIEEQLEPTSTQSFVVGYRQQYLIIEL